MEKCLPKNKSIKSFSRANILEYLTSRDKIELLYTCKSFKQLKDSKISKEIEFYKCLELLKNDQELFDVIKEVTLSDYIINSII
jgi:hypothetical protein